MVWVGDDAADSDYDVLEETPSVPSSLSRQQGVWNPSKEITFINYTTLKIKNIISSNYQLHETLFHVYINS